MASLCPRSSAALPGTLLRVDEADNRAVELIRLLHETKRFAVALRVRHSEIADEVFFRVFSALMTDDGDRHAVIFGDSADNRRIVSVRSVSVALKKSVNRY